MKSILLARRVNNYRWSFDWRPGVTAFLTFAACSAFYHLGVVDGARRQDQMWKAALKEVAAELVKTNCARP